jgi:hypothetical protein
MPEDVEVENDGREADPDLVLVVPELGSIDEEYIDDEDQTVKTRQVRVQSFEVTAVMAGTMEPQYGADARGSAYYPQLAHRAKHSHAIFPFHAVTDPAGSSLMLFEHWINGKMRSAELAEPLPHGSIEASNALIGAAPFTIIEELVDGTKIYRVLPVKEAADAATVKNGPMQQLKLQCLNKATPETRKKIIQDDPDLQGYQELTEGVGAED